MFNHIKKIKEIPTRAFVRMQTASLPVKPETKSARAITQVVPHTSKDRAAVAFGAGFAVVLYSLTVQAFAAYTGLTEVIDNFTRFAMFLLGAMTVLMAVAAGLMFVTAAGNQKQVGKAKDTIKYVVIGMVLVLAIGVGRKVVVELVSGASGGKSGTGGALDTGASAREKAASTPPK